MNPEGGYTRQYRRLWDNPVFRNKQEAAVFSWMKDVAQWKAGRISTKFGPVDLEVGELLIAERTLAEDFGLHRNTLRALIQRLVDEGTIELFRDRCPHRAGTVVRVVNYKEYQGIEECSGPKEDRSGTDDRTEAGPKEDRKRTKNKEGNTGKESIGGGEGAHPRVTGPTPESKAIVAAFDEARAETYGHDQRRLHAHHTDHVLAQRWHDAGADAEFCRLVFLRQCQTWFAEQRAPPDTLKAIERRMDAAIADAIATSAKPPAERSIHGTHRPPERADDRPRHGNGWAEAARRFAESRS